MFGACGIHSVTPVESMSVSWATWAWLSDCVSGLNIRLFASFVSALFFVALAAGRIIEIREFLDAFSHLYKRVCPSVRRSVGPSVGPLVRRSHSS